MSRSIPKLEKSTQCKNFKPSRVKLFLNGRNAHTKHNKHRKVFPSLRNIAYDINEVSSLDLAHADKLAKLNKDLRYFSLRLTVSHVIQVGPLKSKYAITTADAFKRMIKSNRIKKVLGEAGTMWVRFSEPFVRKMKLKVIKFSTRKNWHLQ